MRDGTRLTQGSYRPWKVLEKGLGPGIINQRFWNF